MKDFTTVYKEIRPYVFNYILKKCKNYDLAEELTSQTMIKVHRNYDNFDHKNAKFSTYALISANSVLTDHWRKKRLETVSIQDFFETYEYDIPIMSHTLDPYETMANNDLGDAIEEAITNLPENISEINELYFIEQLKMVEIEKELGIPEGTIKVNIHKGRKILKEKLKHFRFAS